MPRPKPKPKKAAALKKKAARKRSKRPKRRLLGGGRLPAEHEANRAVNTGRHGAAMKVAAGKRRKRAPASKL